MDGVIVRGVGGFYYVPTDRGVAECRARGRLRKQGITPMVGDRVKLTIVNQTPLQGAVEEICPRKNYLIRPPVANIDTIVIVAAATCPAPDYFMMDKLIASAEHMDIEIVIVINKTDLTGEAAAAEPYRKAGYPVFPVCALDGRGIEALKAHISGKTAAFAGNSGVGKSSILNQFGLGLATGEVSKIERGRHTTRHVELYPNQSGGYVMDTPGFSLLDVFDVTADELERLFVEFEPHVKNCRFSGCKHVGAKAKDCGVIAAAQRGAIAPSRYESYRMLYDQLKEIKEWEKS